MLSCNNFLTFSQPFNLSPHGSHIQIWCAPGISFSRSFFRISENAGNSVRWYIGVDFSAVFPRVCQAEDFEEWVPPDQTGEKCILGHRTTYRRRKQDAKCFKRGSDHILNVTHCNCTAESYGNVSLFGMVPIGISLFVD